MANHLSSEKRIRQEATRNVANRYHGKTARNAVKDLRSTKDKAKASEMLPKVYGILDKQAKRKNLHKNKVANLKSSLAKHVNSL